MDVVHYLIVYFVVSLEVMERIKVRFIKDEAVSLQQVVLNQDGELETTNCLSITQRELESLVEFFCKPAHGRHGFYHSKAEPLVVSFNSEDFGYSIERDGVSLNGFRFPPGSVPIAPDEPPKAPPSSLPTIFRFIGINPKK